MIKEVVVNPCWQALTEVDYAQAMQTTNASPSTVVIVNVLSPFSFRNHLTCFLSCLPPSLLYRLHGLPPVVSTLLNAGLIHSPPSRTLRELRLPNPIVHITFSFLVPLIIKSDHAGPAVWGRQRWGKGGREVLTRVESKVQWSQLLLVTTKN